MELVPLAGIEPALLAELDFESSASTNSATGASDRGLSGRVPSGRVAKRAEYSCRAGWVNRRVEAGPASSHLSAHPSVIVPASTARRRRDRTRL
jgi:hypothetical protein